MNCIRCPGRLTAEIYEGIEIDRCARCHGAWLDAGELFKIVRKKQKTFQAAMVRDMLSAAYKGVPEAEIKSEEHCPKCNDALRAVNYGYSSGVVVDTCSKGHGVWLDGKELDKAQMFSEHGEEELKKNGKAWKQIAQKAKDDYEAEATARDAADFNDGEGLVFNALEKVIKKISGL